MSDDERRDNMILCSMPLTNEEIKKAGPFLVITVIVLLIIMIFLNGLSDDENNKEQKQKTVTEQNR